MKELEIHPWKLRFEIREDEQHCEMVIHLDTGLKKVSGEGKSHRNPSDPSPSVLLRRLLFSSAFALATHPLPFSLAGWPLLRLLDALGPGLLERVLVKRDDQARTADPRSADLGLGAVIAILARRLSTGAATLLLVTVLVFLLIQLSAGGPLGDTMDSEGLRRLTPEMRQELAKVLRNTGEFTDSKLLARTVYEAREALGMTPWPDLTVPAGLLSAPWRVNWGCGICPN